MYVKAILMVLAGSLASLLLIARSPSLITCALVTIAVWAFCRAYYFAFYVVERYVDSGYRFSGLGSFARYLWKQARSTTNHT